MLKELEFKNFLPFKSQKVDLPLEATIAVVGRNGRGKSSMLEGILFALYGEGRDDLKKLKRIEAGEKEEMYVRLVYDRGDKPELIIQRGLKSSGGGYTKVWLGEELVASGGAKASNNKAQDFIDSAMGVDIDTFKLTSFFGLGTNDTLMQVKPSERLETLQKVAGIDVCIKFQKTANDKYKELMSWIEREVRGAEVLESTIEDGKKLQSEVAKMNIALNNNKELLDNYAVDRRRLLNEEDRYQGLLQERAKLSTDRSNTLKQLEFHEKEVQTAIERFNELKQTSKKLITARDTAVAKLEKYPSIEKLEADNTNAKARIVEYRMNIDLREVALSVEKSDCPLCGSTLDSHQIDIWKEQLTEFNNLLSATLSDVKQVTKRIESVKKTKLELADIKNKLERVNEQSTQVKEEGTQHRKSQKTFKAELLKIEQRLEVIQKEMTGYDKILSDMKELDTLSNKVTADIGGLNESIKNVRLRITANKNAQKKLSTIKSEIEKVSKDARGYKNVADAFARHAIPVQLLESLRTVLERRATRIYQQFASGTIKIIDIQGARPGVDFALSDMSGERLYKSLSSGEKVMFFLAVRVALSQVISAGKDTSVDFLVLDEIAGNLDVENREGLTKLINALLKKYFPQILLVSHVEMRDIFTKTLTVTKQNGVSKIQ